MHGREWAADDEWVPVSPENCALVAGPFYHGTKANLSVGDLLTAGFRSNYDNRVVMNHIYFTTLPKGAGLAAEMAKGDGRPRVYVVVPTADSKTTRTSRTKNSRATRHGLTGASAH